MKIKIHVRNCDKLSVNFTFYLQIITFQKIVFAVNKNFFFSSKKVHFREQRNKKSSNIGLIFMR